MKTTLLLLWSLASLPLQDTCTTCQGVPGGAAAGAYGSSFNGGTNNGANGQMNGEFGMSDGYGDLNSPCRDCRRGRCKSCCKDSTCDMYQHFPYIPDNHGYYYFRPYNYTAVWQHQQWIAQIGGDPRNPYSRSLFIPVYEQFENAAYEPDHKPSNTLSVLPHVYKELPDLEKLLKKPEGDMPPATDATPQPPAPQN
ncbi:MAG: hypothetical protein V4719_06770 [Planctomycetota bacterium]